MSYLKIYLGSGLNWEMGSDPSENKANDTVYVTRGMAEMYLNADHKTYNDHGTIYDDDLHL